MLRAAIIFFVFGILFMVLGMNNIAGITLEIGRTLLFVFLILALVSIVISLFGGRRGPPSVRPLVVFIGLLIGAGVAHDIVRSLPTQDSSHFVAVR